jgi:hypothetical protein
MSLQRVSIYRFSTQFIVCPICKTSSGIGVATEPYQVLSNSVSPNELGEAIRLALNDSHVGIPHPVDWKALALPRLAAAGVETETAFQKKSDLVTALFDGAVLTITPHRNGGGTGNEKGFHPIAECEAQLMEIAPEVVGTATLHAFELCI